LLPYVLGVAAVLAPWVVVRSAAFNARYSAFRNLTFRFDGSYWEAARVLYAWGLIPGYVVGQAFGWWEHPEWGLAVLAVAFLAFPWWRQRYKRFIIGHTSFGGKAGNLSATALQFYGVYLRAAGMAGLLGFFTFLLSTMLTFGLMRSGSIARAVSSVA